MYLALRLGTRAFLGRLVNLRETKNKSLPLCHRQCNGSPELNQTRSSPVDCGDCGALASTTNKYIRYIVYYASTYLSQYHSYHICIVYVATMVIFSIVINTSVTKCRNICGFYKSKETSHTNLSTWHRSPRHLLRPFESLSKLFHESMC